MEQIIEAIKKLGQAPLLQLTIELGREGDLFGLLGDLRQLVQQGKIIATGEGLNSTYSISQ